MELEKDPPSWSPPTPIELKKNATTDDAIEAVAANSLAHWRTNIPAALDGRDPEGIHQARVGLRRLRAALSLFKKQIPAEQRSWIKQEATWLLTQMGPARDLDVFIQDLASSLINDTSENPGLAELISEARSKRLTAYKTATKAINSARTRRFSTRLEAWIEGRGWLTSGNKILGKNKLIRARNFARHRLNRQSRKMKSAYVEVNNLATEERHRLRIAVKKMRYGLIFFSSVLPKKRTAQLTSSLKNLQDTLGHLNDLAVAERTIERLLASMHGAGQRTHIKFACLDVLQRHGEAAARAEPETTKLWRKFKRIPAL
jgi:triphosphatase